MRIPLVGLAALLLGACSADPGWERRVVSIEATLARAEAAGAMRCAPRELALGRAHLGFARFERERGHDARAHEHLAIAEPNAGAAEFLSPARQCDPALAGSASVTDVESVGGPPETPPGVSEPEHQDPVDPQPADPPADGDPPAEEAAGTEVTEQVEGVVVVPDPEPVVVPDVEPPAGEAFGDRDGDGVRDDLDECPRAAGEAGAACPQSYEGLVVRAHRVVLLRPVELDADGIPTQGTSALLLALAQALRDRPTMRVEIGAHTDSEGGELENLAASQRLAERVRALLIDLGVEPERVRARGYGEELPLESNSTPEGRAANRRVEVLRTEAGEGDL